jgi:hypothetical protein
VIITRKCHAFEGHTLSVISSIRRRGVVLLLASLPDGSRALIPAAWTDWDAAGPMKGAPPTNFGDSPHVLGTLSDLLQARTIIDALLNRLAESVQPKESSHAIELGVSRSTKSAPASIDRSMGSDRSGSPRRSNRDSLSSHRPHARGQTGEGDDQ